MEKSNIVLRFAKNREPAYSDANSVDLKAHHQNEWQKLVARFGPLEMKPRFTAVPRETIQALELGTDLSPGFSLLSYFTVEVPEARSEQEFLAAVLEWPDVEHAFVEPVPTTPVVNPNNDPRFPFQGYLGPAPSGIDAIYAWNFPGGDGLGQHLVDVEQGWTLDHDDLSAKNGKIIHGGNSDADRAHGTAVLGEICAVDNNLFHIGAVPNISTVSASSTTGSNVANAILAALNHLTNTVGDFGVILIEQQWIQFGRWPLMIVEVADDVFSAIRLATEKGHLVVEAAGNGANDLDTYQVNSSFILNRSDPNFRDSGAIVVGAGSRLTPHKRLDFSNHGSRVDCYGWGERVDTLSSNPSGAKNLFTTGFSGTSSASPMVTGAALSLQGMKRASIDSTPLNPGTLRALLSDKALNTPSANPAVDRIGVMPDLRRISQAFLQIAPELYIRDTVVDNGNPHKGISSSSPDIIVKNSLVANPQAAFGEGSGTENNIALSDAVEYGSDNFGYIRVRNRSPFPGLGAVATLYWAYPSTILHPKKWNLIGSRNIDVPAGNKLTVAGPFTWNKASVPGPGHYCFIATISHSYDLAPVLATLDPIANFAAFIQTYNNVAWRNFNVADVKPPVGKEIVSLPFDVPNPDPGPFVDLQVEIHAALPPGSRLWLEMPSYIQPTKGLPVSAGSSPNLIKVELLAKGATEPFTSQILPAESAMALQAQVPQQHWKSGPFEIYARQLYQGMEVGRVTWYLQLPPG